MKAEQFMEALNDVKEPYVAEAAAYKKKNRSLTIWRAIAIAACVCLAASLGFTAIQAQKGQGTSYTEDVLYRDAYAEDSLYYEEAAAGDVLYSAKMASAETSAFSGGMNYLAAETSGASSDPSYAVSDEAKIIYTVYMDLQTTQFEEAQAALQNLITQYGGYCENEYSSNNSGSYRYTSYTIRIPVENLESFLSQSEEAGTVTYLNRSAEDISLSYYDTQSRLETARTKLTRLQELLAEAENMEDIIAIEDAITDVQRDIDSYGSTMNYYDSKITYSTVTVNISEVYEVTVEEAPKSFGERVSLAFAQGIKGIGTFAKNLVIWLAESWFWILVIAAILVCAICIPIHCHRKKKKGQQS